MILDNKLGITDMVELARVEEKLSKAQAHKLFTSGFLDDKTAGSFHTAVSSSKRNAIEGCSGQQSIS